MPETPKQEIKLFYCYARKDKVLRDELEVHLSGLKHQMQLINWYDREIRPGAEWEKEINAHLNTAHIILLLVSPDFIASKYCYGIEMSRALERHTAGEAYVLPIILRPVDWEYPPLNTLQVLPSDAEPVTTWGNRDLAWQDVAKGIRKAIKDLLVSLVTKKDWPDEGNGISISFPKTKRDAADLVHRIHGQILRRRADEAELVDYGNQLQRREKSVREIMRTLGHSKEFRENFIDPLIKANLTDVAVELCYERFLGRNAEDSGRSNRVGLAQTWGFEAVIDALVDSGEYMRNFGENDLPPTTAGLAVTSRYAGHLECFFRGKNSHLMHYWLYGERWGKADEGSILTSAPAAISVDQGYIDCWYRGRDGKAWHRQWAANTNQWSGEDSDPLGWNLISAPAVARRHSDTLKCFYRGENDPLRHRTLRDSKWGDEMDLGGIVTSTPSAVSWGYEPVDCFYRGQDGSLLHRWWGQSGDKLAWNPGEHNLGGILTSAPSVVSCEAQKHILDCFYRGADNALWHIWWDGEGWKDHEPVGGWLASAPAAFSLGSDGIVCFYRSGDAHIYRRLWDGHDWHDEEDIEVFMD